MCKTSCVRSPESINRLIRIAYDKKLPPVFIPLLYKSVLQRTDILKFIHQKIPETFPAFRYFLFLKKLQYLQQKIVEIISGSVPHFFLIGFQRLRGNRAVPCLLLNSACAVSGFPEGNLPQKLLRRQIQSIFPADLPGDLLSVLFRDDPHLSAAFLKQFQTDSVKGSHLEPRQAFPSSHGMFQSFFQFFCREIGKGNRGDLRGLHLAGFQKILYPGRQSFRLSGSRSRDHCHDALRRLGRRTLSVVQLIAGRNSRLLPSGFFSGVFPLRRPRNLILFLPVSRRAYHLKKIHLSPGIFGLVRIKKADDSVFAVKARVLPHMTGAQPAYPFRCHIAEGSADILHRHFPQDLKFITQDSEHLFILLLNLLTGSRFPHGRRNDLRKRDQAFKRPSRFSHDPFFSVGQLHDPVIHAGSQLLSADRAFPLIFLRLGRTETDMAFPVSVKMIFSLFRKKFNGSCKPFAFLYGVGQSLIGQRDIQKIRLPSQLRRRMGVRVGDQMETVQRRPPPVHGRI